ncbi:b(0,+)-type amino acid transporter 1-like isoform X2 [Amblyomma americanum]
MELERSNIYNGRSLLRRTSGRVTSVRRRLRLCYGRWQTPGPGGRPDRLHVRLELRTSLGPPGLRHPRRDLLHVRAERRLQGLLASVRRQCHGLGTALNCISNKSSAWAQEMLSAIKCLILLSIVITAAVYFANGGSQLQPPLFSTHVTTTGIVDAFYGALLSFSGWKYINIVAEEMRDPAKDLQRALMAGVLFTTFIYILVNLSYAVVLDFGILTSTEAIASAFAQKTWGDIAYSAVPIAVSISVFGMLCSSFFTAPRLTLAAARRGHLPRFLSLVTIESHIPLTCVFCKGLLSVIFLFFGTLEVLIQASVFVETLWDAIVVLSLLVLRFTMKDRGASYKAPLVVVLLKLVSSVALVIIPLVEHVNYYQYVIILGVHVVGALYYGVFVAASLDCRASHMVTHFFQKFLLSAPCLDELAFMLQESECPELNTLTAQGDANTQSYGSLKPSGSVLTAIYARRDSPSLSKRHRYRDTSAQASDTPVQIGGTCASASSISSRF